MEKRDSSGVETSTCLGQIPNYTAVPLDTVLKDQKFLCYEGPTALQGQWKQILPSLQTSKVQNLAHHQHNNESYSRQSTLSINRLTGQTGNSGFTAVLPKDNYPQDKSQCFCSNDKLPATSEGVLLRQCSVQSSSSSSLEHQKASSALMNTESLQQSQMPHIIVQKTDNLSKSLQNSLYNQQQLVKITNNLPRDSVSQASFANVAVILSQVQPITLQTPTNNRQYAFMPKETSQQKYTTQKAIAVVTPLTQTAMMHVTLSNLARGKEGDPETRTDSQPFIPHIYQSSANESGAKNIHDFTFHTKKVPSVIASTFSQSVKNDKPVKYNQLSGPSENLLPVSNNSLSVERREVLQGSSANCSAQLFSEHGATLMSRNPVGTKPTMNPGMDKLSNAPVQEWSLQRLRNFITQLEQTQKQQQKDVPNNVFKEILNLYWNGDYLKLCETAKSSLYTDIMKEVRLHLQTENSVILQGVSRERLNEMASSFYILDHGYVPPKMGYRSSWLNLSENLSDIPSDNYNLSLLMTLHCKQTKPPDKEVPVKEISENMSELTNEKRKASDEALSERKKHKKAFRPEIQKNSVRKEPVGGNVENTSSGKETEGQNSTNVENVPVENKVESEQQNQTKGENRAPLLESLITQASDGSGHCKKLLTTDTMPLLDTNVSANCVSVKKSILPPEKAVEPDVQVNNSGEDTPSLTESSQVTVESLEQDKKCVDGEKKSDKTINGRKLEKYCCLPKWLQVLGYRNGGLCNCEITSELSHQADALGKVVKKVNIKKKACKLTGTELKRARKKPSQVAADSDSMDELEIVDVITDYKDVLDLANMLSEQVTSHESPSGRDQHQEITRVKFKTRETLINLTLFGTSQARQKKDTSGFMSSDKVPPETLNVRIGSGWNERSDRAKGPERHTPKQQVWNSWKKTHVPSKRSTNTGSKNQKPAKSPKLKDNFYLTSANEQENTNRDQSKRKNRKKISLTRQEQIKKLKRRKLLASFNLKKGRWNYTNHGCKLAKTPFDSTQVINARKNKSNTGLALHFGVLPESFSISDGSSSEKTKQAASAESSSEVKTVVQTKRTWGTSGSWCESPRKKQCFKSTPTLPNTSGFSTFQLFKKKYEEKKQKIVISYLNDL